jgi:hypothetical protein
MANGATAERLRRWWRWLIHDFLDRHDGDGAPITTDGLSFVSRCSVCGRRVLMDSYHQWFAASVQRPRPRREP